MKVATNVMFTQMFAKSGIQIFGEKSVAPMIKELSKFDKGPMTVKPFVGPINPDTLSFYDKKNVLEAVNLIKEKRCGKIKGRTCIDVSKKKKYRKEG